MGSSPTTATNGLVDQRQESFRLERKQCRFESDPAYFHFIAKEYNLRLKVELATKRLSEALVFAEKRNAKAKRFGSRTYDGKNNSLEIHKIGIIAELAVATLFKTDFDKRIFDNSGDDGTDLILPNVGICAIKATTYKDNSYLRAEVARHLDTIGVYIACYVNKLDLSDVWIVGWEYGNEVAKIKQRKLSRYCPWNYIIEEKDLRDPEELVRIVSKGQKNG